MTGTRRRRGSAVVELAMLAPLIVVLITGMVTVARITYTYYTLRKTVYSIARYAGTQQGVNFCDPSDPTVAAAINFGISGTTDGSQPAFVTGLTASMFQIEPDDFNGPCPCSVPGCDISVGGTPPDFIVVNMPNGYQMPVRILGFTIDPIVLRPEVKIPYGGI